MTHCSSWSIDQSHKFHNAPAPYPTVHYSERECAHLCSEWYTAECGTGAFSDLWIWYITSLTTTALVHAAAATTTATATATTATATATTTITIITTTTSSTTTHYYYYYFCYYCCQVSNIKRTKSPNFNVSCLVSQLSLLNPLKPTAYAHVSLLRQIPMITSKLRIILILRVWNPSLRGLSCHDVTRPQTTECFHVTYWEKNPQKSERLGKINLHNCIITTLLRLKIPKITYSPSGSVVCWLGCVRHPCG